MVSTLPFCAAQTKETDIKQKSRNGATLLRTIYSLNAEIMWGGSRPVFEGHRPAHNRERRKSSRKTEELKLPETSPAFSISVVSLD